MGEGWVANMVLQSWKSGKQGFRNKNLCGPNARQNRLLTSNLRHLYIINITVSFPAKEPLPEEDQPRRATPTLCFYSLYQFIIFPLHRSKWEGKNQRS